MYSTIIQGVIFFLIDTVHNIWGNLGEECLPGHAHHKHYEGVIASINFTPLSRACPPVVMRVIDI